MTHTPQPSPQRFSLSWKQAAWILLVAAALCILLMPTALSFLSSYTLGPNKTFEGQSWANPQRLDVWMDSGGIAAERMGHVRILARNDVAVHVQGVCASACTFYLALPTTCTHPASLWMFHRVYARDRAFLRWMGRWDPMRWSIERTAEAFYPEGLGAWQAAIPQGQDLWITGAELVEAGWTRTCPEDGTATGALEEAKVLADTWNAEGPLDAATIAMLRALPHAPPTP